MEKSTFTITGDDTFTVYDRVLTDFADDDASTIAFPNDLVSLKTGKNKNTIFAKDETGNNANVTLRLVRGSSDDQLLQSKLSEMTKDFATTVLANGEFVKRIGDGQANVKRDVYTMQGGVIVRRVDGKENVSGDTTQAVAIYNMTFASARRSIQ